MSEKTLFIVNPISGKGRSRKVVPVIEEFCKNRSLPYSVMVTQYPNHASEIAAQNRRLYKKIIAVGGDGTINEIVNGLAPDLETILGVLPVGSGNDYVKNIGNYKIKDSLNTILDRSKHNVIYSDLGLLQYKEKDSEEVKQRKFINNLGIGFDARVGALKQENSRLSGLISYLFAVGKALFDYRMIEICHSSSGIDINGQKLMISIGNGRCSGGGFYLNPDAEIDDGLLDASIFDKITRKRLVTALPMALLNRLHKVPEVKMWKTDSLEIKLKNPYYIHCDGEIISTNLISANISVIKNGIRVIKVKG